VFDGVHFGAVEAGLGDGAFGLAAVFAGGGELGGSAGARGFGFGLRLVRKVVEVDHGYTSPYNLKFRVSAGCAAADGVVHVRAECSMAGGAGRWAAEKVWVVLVCFVRDKKVGNSVTDLGKVSPGCCVSGEFVTWRG